MKLLCVTDLEQIEDKWESLDIPHHFRCLSVEITFFNIQKDDWERIENQLKEERYHLCISLMSCDIVDEKLKENTLLNAVNNYVSIELKQDLKQEEVIWNQPSIVNKTTSYFNVFLEVAKCVSYTTETIEYKDELSTMNLSSLLIVNTVNYKLAYLFATNRCNYYLLNYPKNTASLTDVASQFRDIVEKLD